MRINYVRACGYSLLSTLIIVLVGLIYPQPGALPLPVVALCFVAMTALLYRLMPTTLLSIEFEEVSEEEYKELAR